MNAKYQHKVRAQRQARQASRPFALFGPAKKRQAAKDDSEWKQLSLPFPGSRHVSLDHSQHWTICLDKTIWYREGERKRIWKSPSRTFATMILVSCKNTKRRSCSISSHSNAKCNGPDHVHLTKPVLISKQWKWPMLPCNNYMLTTSKWWNQNSQTKIPLKFSTLKLLEVPKGITWRRNLGRSASLLAVFLSGLQNSPQLVCQTL